MTVVECVSECVGERVGMGVVVGGIGGGSGDDSGGDVHDENGGGGDKPCEKINQNEEAVK
jgi:hypothetical protein